MEIGYPGGSDGKESACNAGDPGSIPWRRERLLTPVFLPGESHRQGSLTCYGPWGPKSWTDLVTKPPPLEDFLRVSAPSPPTNHPPMVLHWAR